MLTGDLCNPLLHRKFHQTVMKQYAHGESTQVKYKYMERKRFS